MNELESIRDMVQYIEDNMKYLDDMDELDFYCCRISVINRPKFPFLKPNDDSTADKYSGLLYYGLTADNYYGLLYDDLTISKIKRRVEKKKMLMERPKEPGALSEEDKRKKFEELQNIKRDSKGRLNKGALLAKKESCNESKIYLMYAAGATVKEIVAYYGCSKSVVYRVLAKHKQ